MTNFLLFDGSFIASIAENCQNYCFHFLSTRTFYRIPRKINNATQGKLEEVMRRNTNLVDFGRDLISPEDGRKFDG
jgi:hypothetical protein